ncbi:MAG TPA: PKD domain-containing protein, partial [Bacteroidia bacterium]|nr:PKD domain-containing protein [Bacteroidia bacterium]
LPGSSVTVSPTATTTYTVTGTNSNGCTNTATINIVVVAPPATPTITVAGNVLTSSVSGISYQWYLNGSPITGATGQSHTAIQSGSYTVEVFNAGCGSGQSAPVMVTSPAPVAAFTTSSSTICAGATANFTDNSTGGPTSWTWTFPGGSPGSATTQNVSNVMWSAAGTYTVSLTVSNANGSSTYTQTITVNTAPATPTIFQIGNVLVSSVSGASYQWYLNGNPIPGATAQSYTPTQSGNYSVVVFDSAGCASAQSAPLMVIGIDSPGNSVSFISVFPNPANGSFQLTFTAANDNYMLEIHDMLGQIVYSEALPGFSGTYNKTFDLAAYGHGVYIIRLRSNENETNVRVISY